VAGIGDEDHGPGTDVAGDGFVQFAEGKCGGVEILGIGVVRDEVGFVAFTDDSVSGEVDVDYVAGSGGGGEPFVQRAAQCSDGGALFGEEADLRGGERTGLRGAEEAGEVFGVFVGVAELGLGRDVDVAGDADDEGPALGDGGGLGLNAFPCEFEIAGRLHGGEEETGEQMKEWKQDWRLEENDSRL
jgi:hypothetical protein